MYLNTEPNENGKFDFDVFVRKQLSTHQDNFEIQTEYRKSFDRDSERINEFLKDLKPSTRGAAIFACAGANDYFETMEFNVAFEDDYFFVFDKPHIFPLARLIDQNPMYAIVLADTNAARIYVYKRGDVVGKEEIENVKTNRTEQGGWSQMRFQRHIDNFHLRHAKEVVEELDKIVRDEDIKQIILIGDEKVIIPLLREQMPELLSEKIIGTLKLNVNTPEHEFLEEADKAIHRHDTLADKKKIDYLMEQNYDDGLGVVGVEKTLTALANGQVQELYINADFNTIKYHQDTVRKILKAYAPGEDEEMPEVQHAGMIVDELIRRGVEQADDVRFIEDENFLEKGGGVGALLRFRTEGDTVRSATN
jgi:peptide chain release factor subunit 1